MRLSKIKLAGFKSFVDPTTIQFPSNLMGVVGPNGCGKSNVIDAVRWVMGESSAKNLRGDSMDDVIFNGSSARKPVAQASIELVFDNADGTIGGAYASFAEVSIKRVLTREGVSTYYLNGARCRRKDITHIFLGTGLGPRSYSIIEQGMISRLVEARPEELRAFLEEAAGISKYKDRRRETANRIRHTRDNLDRLDDLREEVTKQLAHLERQKRAAERYRSLKQEQRLREAELLALKLASLKEEAGAKESELSKLQTGLESTLAEQRGVEAEIEKLRVLNTDQTDQFNEVQGRYYRVGAEIARLEQSINHRKELKQRQQEELEAASSAASDVSALINKDQSELANLDDALRDLGPGLEQALSSQRASAQALTEAERLLEHWRERWQQLADDIAEVARQVHVEEARQEHLEAQGARAQRESEKLEAEQMGLIFGEIEDRVTELVGSEQELKEARDQSANELATIWKQIEQLREKDSALTQELDAVRTALQDDRGRLASMEALQQAALGTAEEGPTRWLAGSGLADAKRLADRIKVETGWELAAETALGAYLQAVCVDGIDPIAQTLGQLEEGGVTLVEQEGLSAVEPLPLPPLADKVTGPGVVAELLQGVCVAERLSDALKHRRRLGHGQSIITKDGVWVSARWLRVNRKDDPRAGVLRRSEEIVGIKQRVAGKAEEAGRLETAVSSTRNQLQDLETRRAAAQEEAGRRQELYGEVQGQLEALRSQLSQNREREQSLKASSVDIEAELRATTRDREQSQSRLENARTRMAELERTREALQAERGELEARVEDARTKAAEDGESAQTMALKVESRKSSKESAAINLDRLQIQRSQLEERRDSLAKQLSEADEPIASESEALEGVLSERLTVEEAMAGARRALEQCESDLREKEETRTELIRRVNDARQAADEARLAVREAQVRSESVVERFAQTEFSLEEIVQGLADQSPTVEDWEELITKLENRINRLGAINLAAIEEFDEQSERKEYLDRQFADLTEALDTLEAAIRKIDRETRSRFKETFDRVNSGMETLFPRLFGGGHAYLELDGDDLLNAGVTVMARPPGKRNSTIHLLSGGEKALTAVALVFSIFELNPAPFCLLDEVDAPLDDANVSRFCEIVKEMSERVQFLVITHNKATMEMVRQLAGVTMHEPGVSRLVAVDIDEAVKLAAM